MKELLFKKSTNQGLIEGILRVIGRYIYLKYNDSDMARKAIEEFKKRGVEIIERKNWIRINLLGNNEVVRLGSEEVDASEDEEVIEEKLFRFYKNQYEKMGFYVNEGDANAIAS